MVRVKQRYLLFNILYPETKSEFIQAPSAKSLTSRDLLRIIRDAVQLNFGDWGAGVVSSSLQLKYFSQATSTGILRVNREFFRIAWAALTLINAIQSQAVIVTVVRVGGTIRKVEQEAIRRAQAQIENAKSVHI